eukprot:jgi/Orpsp1_1/1192514/evm.model.d7180000093908.1
MKFDDFKKLGKLFFLQEKIEEIYDFIIELVEEKKINIKNIIEEKSLILLFEWKFPGYNNLVSTEIELLKKDRDTNDIINSLNKNLEEKNKILEEKNQSIRRK